MADYYARGDGEGDCPQSPRMSFGCDLVGWISGLSGAGVAVSWLEHRVPLMLCVIYGPERCALAIVLSCWGWAVLPGAFDYVG